MSSKTVGSKALGKRLKKDASTPMGKVTAMATTATRTDKADRLSAALAAAPAIRTEESSEEDDDDDNDDAAETTPMETVPTNALEPNGSTTTTDTPRDAPADAHAKAELRAKMRASMKAKREEKTVIQAPKRVRTSTRADGPMVALRGVVTRVAFKSNSTSDGKVVSNIKINLLPIKTINTDAIDFVDAGPDHPGYMLPTEYPTTEDDQPIHGRVSTSTAKTEKPGRRLALDKVPKAYTLGNNTTFDMIYNKEKDASRIDGIVEGAVVEANGLMLKVWKDTAFLGASDVVVVDHMPANMSLAERMETLCTTTHPRLMELGAQALSMAVHGFTTPSETLTYGEQAQYFIDRWHAQRTALAASLNKKIVDLGGEDPTVPINCAHTDAAVSVFREWVAAITKAPIETYASGRSPMLPSMLKATADYPAIAKTPIVCLGTPPETKHPGMLERLVDKYADPSTPMPNAFVVATPLGCSPMPNGQKADAGFVVNSKVISINYALQFVGHTTDLLAKMNETSEFPTLPGTGNGAIEAAGLATLIHMTTMCAKLDMPRMATLQGLAIDALRYGRYNMVAGVIPRSLEASTMTDTWCDNFNMDVPSTLRLIAVCVTPKWLQRVLGGAVYQNDDSKAATVEYVKQVDKGNPDPPRCKGGNRTLVKDGYQEITESNMYNFDRPTLQKDLNAKIEYRVWFPGVTDAIAEGELNPADAADESTETLTSYLGVQPDDFYTTKCAVYALVA